jgi:hypothetical protein
MDGPAIEIPNTEVESGVSSVRDGLALNSSHVRSVTGSYCCVPPRQDACDEMNKFPRGVRESSE